MLKKTMVLWFAIAAGVAAFALLAQAGSTPARAVEPAPAGGTRALETFVTVDQVTAHTNRLGIRGLLLGGSVVVDRTYDLPYWDAATEQGLAQRCERMALLMLTKPGAYQLDMEGGTTNNSLDCTLRRNE
jgi:hypothetical protein